MSNSHIRIICSGINVQQTDVNSDKIQVTIQAPVHLTYDMDRFVEEGGKAPVNGHLRSPIIFGHAQSQEEAEARMHVQLLAFDKKFGQRGGLSTNK
ncbi:hypothetical protein GGI43DRAFT_372322 [Trichoderma evansii]